MLARPTEEPGHWQIELEDSGGGSGSKDRATVALVSEQVKSVERLIDAGFKSVQRELDKVSGLPERVARLEERVDALIQDANSKTQRTLDRITWKRGLLSAGCLTLLGTLVNLAIRLFG